MSQPAASVSAPQTPATTTPSDIERIFDAALKSYKKKTKKDLKNDDLFKKLETCDSPAAILTKFQAAQFETGSEDSLRTWLVSTLNVLCAFSNTLGEGAFPPAKTIFAGVGVLLLAAKGVAASRDILIDIFGRIESFFVRLDILTKVSLTQPMTDKMVQITVEILDILATATKEMQQSVGKKFLKRVAGWTDLEDGINKLDKLTIEEVAMISAQLLKVAHNTDINVTEVKEGVKSIDKKFLAVKSGIQLANDNVNAVGEKVQAMGDIGMVIAKDVKAVLEQVDSAKRNQLREKLRMWQSPPDPSTNHDIAGDLQHEGTAEWFIDGDEFLKWMAAGSLFWVHGKAGSGKSILCSAIINHVTMLCRAGLASMAYFYFDFRDVDKKSRRHLLSSLLVQLSTCSDAFCDILSCLYETNDSGARHPGDTELTKCLKEMLTLPDQGLVYLIMDALDECPDTPGVPSAREKVLDLIKDLVGLQLPNLRICVTSRPEVDISNALGSLASKTVSLQDELGQKKDISDYIRFVVHSGSGKFMKRWRPEDKEDIIEKLLERADGMFRWVFCQLEMLRNCLPKNVRRILRELPATLDETYERMLREILEVNADDVYRLLQCIAVSTRPLGVDELAEVLALNFDAASEGIPALDEDLRSGDEEQDVLSACSNLIAVVKSPWGSRVVQFAHFSVKEFLTSDRLANLKPDISRFHIRLEPAHTVIAQVSLAILLQTDYDDRASSPIFPYGDQNISPLFDYATENWIDHAHFGNVSSRVEHGMRRLFDPTKPHFAAWLKSDSTSSYRDNGWRSFRRGESYGALSYGCDDLKDDAPLCLYYAALCGFPDLTKHLIAMYPQHINAKVGENGSPLVAALYNRHFQVAELLHQHGAVLPIGHEGRTLLHSASGDGLVDVAQWLLNIGADANAQEDGHRTPLHFAAAKGHLEIVRILLERGGDINAAAGEDNRTPLHEASQGGHIDVVRLLIQNGADARTDFSSLFLLASSSKNINTIQFFFQLEADVNARYRRHQTLLHLASAAWGDEAAQLLIEHGADVHARDQSQSTPLHLASVWTANKKTARLLIKHGADVNSRDQSQSTPLHVASSNGRADIARLLIEHGADVHARDQSQSTPLHLASSSNLWNADIARVLIKHGADVCARDQGQSTPLHILSSVSFKILVPYLFTENDKTPLHKPEVSYWVPKEYLRVLLENGADVDAEDDEGQTPFQIASSKGYHEMAQLLLDQCACVVSKTM
ncbi:hypothetical protein V8E53_009927 [Lactarius tabidus]